METIKFTLTGRTPLLMHADNVEWSDYLKEWRMQPENKKKSVPGDDRSPGFTWIGYLYHDGENVVMPTLNLMGCLRRAGASVPSGHKQKTLKEASQTDIFFDETDLEFHGGNEKASPIPYEPIFKLRSEAEYKKCLVTVEKLGFKIDMRRVPVGTSKHVRTRPRFDTWRVRGQLTLADDSVITFDRLKLLFDYAGRVGLGDWRPGSRTPGNFGMYTAKLEHA